MREWTADDVREMMRAYIKANKLTQDEFAHRIGISPPLLSMVLSGQRPPTGRMLSFFKLTRKVKVVYVK